METEFKVGNIVDAEITKVTDFGAFVRMNEKGLGLIHISQIANTFVKDINQHLKIGDKVKARIIKLGPGKKIDLSLKSPSAPPAKRNRPDFKNQGFAKKSGGFKTSDFEEKLKNFLGSSQQDVTDRSILS